MTSHSNASQYAYTPGSGLPVALPLGPQLIDPSTQVSGVSGEFGETNTPLTPSAESKPSRVGHVQLARIDALLPNRDRLVIERVGQHRYLSTHQIQHFAFTTHETEDAAATTTRRVLRRLERAGLLRRLIRRVGGVRAGSSATVWQLAPAAARLLRAEGSTYRPYEPSLRLLQHCLAVGDVHLAVRALEQDAGVTAVDVQVEPASWRRYTGPGGEPKWLQPDLAAVISTSEYDDRWFIEVDLGTESLPTLLKKCGQYEAYRASGFEQATNGAFPLVLWVFATPNRAERLAHSVARSPRLTPQLFRYAEPATLLQVLRGVGA